MAIETGNIGGAMISGTWINRINGKKIVVRDCIQDGDNIVVMTNNGVLPMSDFSKYYIQQSDEEYAPSNYLQDAKISNDDMKELAAAGYGQSNALTEIFIPPHEREAAQKRQATTQETPRPVSEKPEKAAAKPTKTAPENKDNGAGITEKNLIDKIFTKTNSRPQINLTISWADIPKKELQTLIDYLDVDINNIIDYIYDNYVNDTIKGIIGDNIRKLICDESSDVDVCEERE